MLYSKSAYRKQVTLFIRYIRITSKFIQGANEALTVSNIDSLVVLSFTNFLKNKHSRL